jgi:2-phosphosulfolactate phosphatase
VAVIGAGERWRGGALRPAFEDLVGAGAIIDQLGSADLSPEAAAARDAYRAARPDLVARLLSCVLARELIAWGYAADVEIASRLDASDAVPVLNDGAYSARAGSA